MDMILVKISARPNAEKPTTSKSAIKNVRALHPNSITKLINILENLQDATIFAMVRAKHVQNSLLIAHNLVDMTHKILVNRHVN